MGFPAPTSAPSPARRGPRAPGAPSQPTPSCSEGGPPQGRAASCPAAARPQLGVAPPVCRSRGAGRSRWGRGGASGPGRRGSRRVPSRPRAARSLPPVSVSDSGRETASGPRESAGPRAVWGHSRFECVNLGATARGVGGCFRGGRRWVCGAEAGGGRGGGPGLEESLASLRGLGSERRGARSGPGPAAGAPRGRKRRFSVTPRQRRPCPPPAARPPAHPPRRARGTDPPNGVGSAQPRGELLPRGRRLPSRLPASEGTARPGPGLAGPSLRSHGPFWTQSPEGEFLE